MTADLVAFLRARLDEDEQAARDASPAPWITKTGQPWLADHIVFGQSKYMPDRISQVCDLTAGQTRAADAAHIIRHDPARVLAEVDAKRRITDEHPNVNDGDCGTCITPRWGYPTHGGASAAVWPCQTLRLLALPYADHSDYREEWRP
jgi:hypothetical protein